jgi:hypothetical protein
MIIQLVNKNDFNRIRFYIVLCKHIHYANVRKDAYPPAPLNLYPYL